MNIILFVSCLALLIYIGSIYVERPACAPTKKTKRYIDLNHYCQGFIHTPPQVAISQVLTHANFYGDVSTLDVDQELGRRLSIVGVKSLTRVRKTPH